MRFYSRASRAVFYGRKKGEVVHAGVRQAEQVAVAPLEVEDVDEQLEGRMPDILNIFQGAGETGKGIGLVAVQIFNRDFHAVFLGDWRNRLAQCDQLCVCLAWVEVHWNSSTLHDILLEL